MCLNEGGWRFMKGSTMDGGWVDGWLDGWMEGVGLLTESIFDFFSTTVIFEINGAELSSCSLPTSYLLFWVFKKQTNCGNVIYK